MTIYTQPSPARRDTLEDLYDRLCANFCAALPKTLTVGPDEPPFYAQIFKAIRDEELIGAVTREGALAVGGYRNYFKMYLFHRIEGWTRQIEKKVGNLLDAWDDGEPIEVGICMASAPDAFNDGSKDLVLRKGRLRFHIAAKKPMKRYQISTTATYKFDEFDISTRGYIAKLYESCERPTNEYCEVLIRQEIVEEGIEIANRFMLGAKFDYCLTSPVEVTEVHKSTKVSTDDDCS